MTKTEVKDVDGTFFEKLRGLNIENDFLNKQLPLNEDENNFDKNLMISITIKQSQGFIIMVGFCLASSDVSLLG